MLSLPLSSQVDISLPSHVTLPTCILLTASVSNELFHTCSQPGIPARNILIPLAEDFCHRQYQRESISSTSTFPTQVSGVIVALCGIFVQKAVLMKRTTLLSAGMQVTIKIGAIFFLKECFQHYVHFVVHIGPILLLSYGLQPRHFSCSPVEY